MENINKAGIGMLLRKGEGYFDPINNKIRLRRLCNTEIPKNLYETTEMEVKVQENMDASLDSFTLNINTDNEYVFSQDFNIPNSKYYHWKYRNTEDYNRKYDPSNTVIKIDEEEQVLEVKCNCREFNKGCRNISQPCSHILSLYITSAKFVKLKNLERNKEYKIKDIMETLL